VDPVVPDWVIYGPVVPKLLRTWPSVIAISPFVDIGIVRTMVVPVFPVAFVVYAPVNADASAPPKKVPVFIVKNTDCEFPIPCVVKVVIVSVVPPDTVAVKIWNGPQFSVADAPPGYVPFVPVKFTYAPTGMAPLCDGETVRVSCVNGDAPTVTPVTR
jgi:hypothetical protein